MCLVDILSDIFWVFVIIVIVIIIFKYYYDYYSRMDGIDNLNNGKKLGGGRTRKQKPIIRVPNVNAAAPIGILNQRDKPDAATIVETTGDVIKDLKLHPRSRSESAVINYLESATGKKFPTVYPKWLVWKGKRLELDGYNEELRIAMEFSGPLHTKWTPSYEPYEKYFDRVIRDVVKEKICKKKNIGFFTVDASLPSRHWKAYVNSRLYDILTERNEENNDVSGEKSNLIRKPFDYIPRQYFKPFRNKQIEKELGLDAEWKAAKAL